MRARALRGAPEALRLGAAEVGRLDFLGAEGARQLQLEQRVGAARAGDGVTAPGEGAVVGGGEEAQVETVVVEGMVVGWSWGMVVGVVGVAAHG